MASTRKSTRQRRQYKIAEHKRLRSKKVRAKMRKQAKKNPLKKTK